MSQSNLTRSIKLTEFPFTNRVNELRELRSFCEQRSDCQILEVSGRSGIGKSRLLSYFAKEMSDDCQVHYLNSRNDTRLDSGLLNSLEKSLKKQDTRPALQRTKSNVKDVLSQTPKNVRNFAPTLTKDVMPFGGNIASKMVSAAVGASGTDKSAVGNRIKVLLSRAIESAKGRKILFIFDDIQALSQDEQTILSYILSISSSMGLHDTYFIFGTRPATNESHSLLKPIFERLAFDGKYQCLPISPMDDEAMLGIAASIIANPASITGQIKSAKGIPQTFFSYLMQLNMTGNLSIKNKLIVLPTEKNLLSRDGNSLLEALDRYPSFRWLINAISVSRFDISYSTLKQSFALFGLSDELTLIAAVSQLASLDVLEISNDDEVTPRVYVEHDSIKDAAVMDLKKNRYLEYLQTNEIVAELASLEYQLQLTTSLKSDNHFHRANAERVRVARVLALREAKSSQWVKEAQAILAVCEMYEWHNDTIDVGESLLEVMKDSFEPSTGPLKQIQKSLRKAYFYRGLFARVVDLQDLETVSSGEDLYMIAMAHLILKGDQASVRIARLAQEKLSSDPADQAWQPILKLTEASALQESGGHDTCEIVYQDTLNTIDDVTSRRIAGQFKIASPLFVDCDMSLALTEEAYQQFIADDDLRLAGMALNNKGYTYLRLHDYSKALSCFDQSILFLDEKYPHESVFPLNNKAFVLLMQNKPADAESVLTSCLFRQLWPDYETSILLNFAYTIWLQGRQDGEKFLDRITGTPGMDVHEWASWQQVYARCMLKLMPHGSMPNSKMISDCEALLRTLKDTKAIAPYWNALGRTVYEKYGLTLDEAEEAPSQSSMSDISNPTYSLIRPSALCFAHI